MNDGATTHGSLSGSYSPESILERLWREGRSPSIQSFVASRGPFDVDALLPVLRVDQRRRWASGQRVDVRLYVSEFPVLAEDPESLFELVYHEWLVREELGESPSFEEYQLAFPDLAERLKMQIEIHQSLSFNDESSAYEQQQARTDWLDTLADGPAVLDPDDAPPEVPGYKILGELGRGGMGVVYRALNVDQGRVVALKMILAGRLATAQDRLRLQNEAQAVAALDHPNIVPILDSGQQDRLPYFSMRLIEGESLAQRQGGVRDDGRTAARLMMDIAGAVHHAHQRGILHRDLKPANILVDEDGRPYVTDFGLAKRIHANDGLTRTGWFMGSPGYMAPEQAAGDPSKITTATDVYGLGAILYAVLTGRAPFDCGSVQETLNQLRNRAPDPPSSVNPKAPHPLELICLKCLEKDPARRYSSAEAFADDLRRWLVGEPIAARPVGFLVRTWLWARRNPSQAALTGALATVFLAAIVVGATLWYRAEASLRDARLAESRERTARLGSQARLSLATAAIKENYVNVRDSLWLLERDVDGSRARLLRQAGAFYKKLQTSLQDDPTPEAQAQLANAYLELGQITLESRGANSKTESAAAFRRGVEIRRQLADAAPNNHELQLDVAKALAFRGLSERKVGDLDGAQISFEAAREIFERVSVFPDCSHLALSELSWAVGNLAAIQINRGRPRDAHALHQGVLSIRERLQRERPDVLTYQIDHAWALLDLAITHEKLQQITIAISSATQATDELENALQKSPREMLALYRLVQCLDYLAALHGAQKDYDAMVRDSARALKYSEEYVRLEGVNPTHVEMLANLYAAHARRLVWTGDRRGARGTQAKAIELYEKLAHKYPGAFRVQSALARCVHVEAAFALEEGDLTSALASVEKSLDLRQALLRGSPDDQPLAASVAEDLLTRVVLLVQSHRRAEALAPFSRAESLLASLKEIPALLHYDFACALSRLSAGDETFHREEEAVACLRVAVAHGYRNIRHLLTDPDLDPLRGRADYQAFVRDLTFPADPFAH
jgi:tetratricopeptide (TPR) repeat protein